ncbi:substrate-binding domain-containing protein [Puerhibacterium sp. TATVAM-FAB25]|uniref:substrate-binding domain-containing protein n=1 Tax=Puerhibacterium sp. TATVAM-FAB25 TaxID=3093699 RepID=UPI00397AA57B
MLVVAPPSFAHGVLGSLIVEGLARELEARELGLVQLTGHPEGLSPASHLSPAVVLTSATPDDPDFTGWRASFRVPVLPAFPGRDAHIAAAARAQAHHARSRGYSRVVYVAPPEPALATMSALRHDALGSWARRHGIAVADSVVLGRGRADWAEQARRLHDSHGPDVLVCAYNDDVALAVLAGASDAGLSVPTDLAVIGADDTPAAERSVPALTSVGADFSAFVNAMADTVEAAASGRPVELPSLPVDLQVAVRASSP